MKRPSPAIVIATVALFFSMAGAGIAASHYLITSTSQIKPSVLKSLRGKQGPSGAPGSAGQAGATGPAGVVTASAITDVAGPQQTLCAYGSSCDSATSTAACPSGTTVISGGWSGTVSGGSTTIDEPNGSTGWTVTIVNSSTLATGVFAAEVECAS